MAVSESTAPVAPALNSAEPADDPADRCAARYAWALLLARIYEVFPLLGRSGRRDPDHRLVTDAPTVGAILAHPGEPTAPPRIAPARGPPLWETAGAELVDQSLQWGASAAAYQFDQRIAW